MRIFKVKIILLENKFKSSIVNSSFIIFYFFLFYYFFHSDTILFIPPMVYLLGTSFGVSDMTKFDKAYSVWSWNNGKWEVYSLVHKIQQLLTKYGLKQPNEIQPKKGFWVYFK